MAVQIGRNRNTNDEATVTTVTLNSVTATTVAASNVDRISFLASLDAGITNVDVFIRYYPAATDNNQAGYLIARRTANNDAFFFPNHEMPVDNIYTGEISAITASGTVDIHITEY